MSTRHTVFSSSYRPIRALCSHPHVSSRPSKGRPSQPGMLASEHRPSNAPFSHKTRPEPSFSKPNRLQTPLVQLPGTLTLFVHVGLHFKRNAHIPVPTPTVRKPCLTVPLITRDVCHKFTTKLLQKGSLKEHTHCSWLDLSQ